MANTGDVDTKALGALRPGDSADKLAAAAGRLWRTPRPEEAGRITYLDEHVRFKARLDRQNRIGELSFELTFDPTADVAGARMRMTEADLAKALPSLNITELPMTGGAYRAGHLDLGQGATMMVQVGHGRVTRIAMHKFPEPDYPEIGPLPLPLPTTAFNVQVVPGLQARDASAPDGWCFGLPRGITQAQWPLSHATGFPLQHHFTVRVPEPYRTKGPEHVALAFFSEAYREGKTSDAVTGLMDQIFDGRGVPDRASSELQPFLDHLKARHPMEFRSKDILYQLFAAIWLTEVEFTGPVCLPPRLIRTPANAMCADPGWVTTTGLMRSFSTGPFDPANSIHRRLGRAPLDPYEILLLKITERINDPNVGRQSHDRFEQLTPDGYIPAYSEAWDKLGLTRDTADMHFGGTVFPAQAMPPLSPFFLEIEETPGDINFGTGNGQLDLISMQIDWAQ